MVAYKNCIHWFKKNGNTVVDGKDIDPDWPIVLPRSIEDSGENHITFITKKLSGNIQELVHSTQCKVIIVEKSLFDETKAVDYPDEKTYILSSNPKQDLIEFSKVFFRKKRSKGESLIHEKAFISEGAQIGTQTQIDAFAVVEGNVTIGKRCIIGSNSIVKENTIIGDDVIIGSCSVIGSDGFGYVKNETTKEYDLFPHFGKVVVHDKVSIGNNTCIDRGSLSDTIIERGVKIDNLVHIAHNVRIGENSLIIACSMIAGSVSIGRNSWVSPSSAIRNAVTLGENVMVGLASTVTKSVADNQTVIGSPALPQKDFFILNKQQKEILIRLKSERKSSE